MGTMVIASGTGKNVLLDMTSMVDLLQIEILEHNKIRGTLGKITSGIDESA